MSKIVKLTKEELKNRIISAAQKAFGEVELPDFNIEVPADTSFGDYASNAAMVSARALKQNPRAIATAIAESITRNDCDSGTLRSIVM